MTVPGVTSQIADGRLPFRVLHHRDRDAVGKHHVERAGGEPHHPRRHALDDGVLDAVEIRAARFPVIRVACQLDGLVLLVLDELERTRADRLSAHLLGRHMAGIDRPGAAGNLHQEGRLRPLQVEGDLEVAVGGEMVEVPEDREAGIGAQLFRRFLHQQIVRALDVPRRERLAVMPLDALTQLEGQPGAVLAPGPLGCQIRNDRLKAGLLHALVEQHQIVEHPHHRPHRKGGRLLQDGHGGRAVWGVDLEDPSRLLRQDGAAGGHAGQEPKD